jgi:hypothetical protein
LRCAKGSFRSGYESIDGRKIDAILSKGTARTLCDLRVIVKDLLSLLTAGSILGVKVPISMFVGCSSSTIIERGLSFELLCWGLFMLIFGRLFMQH